MTETENEALYDAFAKEATAWRYSLTEAATMLGITAATLRQQIANGSLKARKVGPIWTVTAHEVERYRHESRRT